MHGGSWDRAGRGPGQHESPRPGRTGGQVPESTTRPRRRTSWPRRTPRRRRRASGCRTAPPPPSRARVPRSRPPAHRKRAEPAAASSRSSGSARPSRSPSAAHERQVPGRNCIGPTACSHSVVAVPGLRARRGPDRGEAAGAVQRGPEHRARGPAVPAQRPAAEGAVARLDPADAGQGRPADPAAPGRPLVEAQLGLGVGAQRGHLEPGTGARAPQPRRVDAVGRAGGPVGGGRDQPGHRVAGPGGVGGSPVPAARRSCACSPKEAPVTTRRALASPAMSRPLTRGGWGDGRGGPLRPVRASRAEV